MAAVTSVAMWQSSSVKKPSKPFREMLESAMKLRGFDGADLARATNITPATISRYRSGERIPAGPELVAVAKVLRIDAEELLGSDAIVVAAESILEDKPKRGRKKALRPAEGPERGAKD